MSRAKFLRHNQCVGHSFLFTCTRIRACTHHADAARPWGSKVEVTSGRVRSAHRGKMLAWAVCLAAVLPGLCEFSCIHNRCGDNATAQSLLILHTFVTATHLDPVSNGSGGHLNMIQQPGLSVLTANLSGRGITSIAPDGLDCWASSNGDTDDPTDDGVLAPLSSRLCRRFFLISTVPSNCHAA